MLEAKSTGYLAMMRDKPFFWEEIIVPKLVTQARNQVTAAAGHPIEWHFAERDVADYMRAKFAEKDIRITVIYTPPRPARPQ